MRTSSGPLDAGSAERLLGQNLDFTAIVRQRYRPERGSCSYDRKRNVLIYQSQQHVEHSEEGIMLEETLHSHEINIYLQYDRQDMDGAESTWRSSFAVCCHNSNGVM
jgi:hypothetical protein